VSNVVVKDQNQELLSIYQRNDVSQYISVIEDMIRRNYRGITSIEHNFFIDPEIPGREQICFEIYITGDPDNIIEDQKKFYKALIKSISSDIRRHFTFTYKVS
jgi:hypothetical protein